MPAPTEQAVPADLRARHRHEAQRRQSRPTSASRRSRALRSDMGGLHRLRERGRQVPGSGDMYDLDSQTPTLPAARRSIRAAQGLAAASRKRDDRVLAGRTRSNHHGVHGHRLRLLPQVSTRRSPSTTGWASACVTCSIRARVPARTRGTRPKRCGARPTARRRSRAPSAARVDQGQVPAASRHQAQYELGDDLGVEGTPAIFTHERRLDAAATWPPAQLVQTSRTRKGGSEHAARLASALQQRQLVRRVPSHSLASSGGGLLLGDHRPLRCQLGVELLEALLAVPAFRPRRRSPRPGTPARTACSRCTPRDR